VRFSTLLSLLTGLAACGAGDDGGGDGSSSDLAFCVEETNRFRAMDGHAALARSAEVEAYATAGAAYDHTATPHAHFSSDSGGGIAFAENECPVSGNWFVMGDPRTTTTECNTAFYSEGPGGGHYDNMMGSYATVGCGVFVDVNQGVTIVQDFGL
jgi:hypothetical protein